MTTNEETKKDIKTIDLTPTWEYVVSVWLHIIDVGSGTDESRKLARNEIIRAAKLADLYVASAKNS